MLGHQIIAVVQLSAGLASANLHCRVGEGETCYLAIATSASLDSYDGLASHQPVFR